MQALSHSEAPVLLSPWQIQLHLNNLANDPDSDRLKSEFQDWPTSDDGDYQIMVDEFTSANRDWRYGRNYSEVLYHLENVTDRMKDRLSDDYRRMYDETLARFRQFLYVMLEVVDAHGFRFRNTLTYINRTTVASIVESLTPCNYLEIAYGVKIKEPGMAWTIPPSRLKWVNNRPWTENMTMQELFRDVPKADNERYYIVVSRLDVKTKYTNPTYVLRVHNAVYWLKDLYCDINGMLRSLLNLTT
jgi:hypothetical protein